MRSFVAGGMPALALAYALVSSSLAFGADAPAATPVAATAAFDPLARGQMLTRWFFAGQLDSLQGVFDATMGAMMQPERLRNFYGQVQAQLGAAKALVSEEVESRDSLQVYTRLGKYEKSPQDVEVMWAFDPRGKVAGFSVRPAPIAIPSRFLDYQTKTALHLPFDGEWFVHWGGRTVRENAHAVAMDQRFALDLVKHKAGKSYEGDGKSNARYFCWGAVIRAPAAGTVVAVLDDVDDNRPGTMNEAQPLGNHVILDHGNGEFSFLCHLQRRSVAVKAGQTVQPGDTLGLCGNSGRSSEPHLHYHLQNTATPLQGEGLPAFFNDYRADGAPVAHGEPKRKQTIAPAPPGSAQPPGAGTKKKRPADKSSSGMGDASRTGDGG